VFGKLGSKAPDNDNRGHHSSNLTGRRAPVRFDPDLIITTLRVTTGKLETQRVCFGNEGSKFPESLTKS
jgi:hypothetical protein